MRIKSKSIKDYKQQNDWSKYKDSIEKKLD